MVSLDRAEDALQVASKVLDAVKVQVSHGGRDLHLSVSIGIGVFPDDGDDGEAD